MEMKIIDFDMIREKIQLKFVENLEGFFDYYFDDLLLRMEKKEAESDKISKTIFAAFMDLPYFIAEKIFEAFNRDSTDRISKKNFNLGIHNLYFGSLEILEQITFDMFDFSKSGKIHLEDVLLLLNNFNFSEKYPKNCDLIVEKFFLNKKYMTFSEYIDTIETINSDVLILCLLLIYDKKPFTQESIKYFEHIKHRKNSMTNSKFKPNHVRSNLAAPSNNILSNFPVLQHQSKVKRKFGKKNILDFKIINETLHEHTNLIECADDEEIFTQLEHQGNEEPLLQNFQLKETQKKSSSQSKLSNMSILSMSRKNISKIFPKLHESSNNNSNNNSKINIVENNSKNNLEGIKAEKEVGQNSKSDIEVKNSLKVAHSFFSPKVTKKVDEEIKLIMEPVEDSLNCNSNSTNHSLINDDSNDIILNKTVYKMSSENRLVKYNIRIIGKEIFLFRFSVSKNTFVFFRIQPLNGYFVASCDESILFGKTFYPIALLNTFGNTVANLNNVFFWKKKTSMQECLITIEKILNFKNINDYYKILNEIDRGQFGQVWCGMDKKDSKNVAIKKLKKAKLSLREMSLIRMEIDLLRYMSYYDHPNVVKFHEAFEDRNYIYIVMEYLNGGTLHSYLNENEPVNENQLKSIIIQIVSGISFFNKFGIVHRDIKAHNIILTNSISGTKVKLIDFGLSKILGKTETANEGYGTLIYSAPELLLKQQYNKKVDIWSFGVLLYYMISYIFPFDGIDISIEEITKKICNDKLNFPEISKYYSNDIKSLIKCCLIKNYKERIDIEKIQTYVNDWVI